MPLGGEGRTHTKKPNTVRFGFSFFFCLFSFLQVKKCSRSSRAASKIRRFSECCWSAKQEDQNNKQTNKKKCEPQWIVIHSFSHLCSFCIPFLLLLIDWFYNMSNTKNDFWLPVIWMTPHPFLHAFFPVIPVLSICSHLIFVSEQYIPSKFIGLSFYRALVMSGQITSLWKRGTHMGWGDVWRLLEHSQHLCLQKPALGWAVNRALLITSISFSKLLHPTARWEEMHICMVICNSATWWFFFHWWDF